MTKIIKFEMYSDVEENKHWLACWIGGARLHTPLLQPVRIDHDPVALLSTILQSPDMTATQYAVTSMQEKFKSREEVVKAYLPLIEELKQAFSDELFSDAQLLDPQMPTVQVYSRPLAKEEIQMDLPEMSFWLEEPVCFEPPKRVFETETPAPSQKKSLFKLKY